MFRFIHAADIHLDSPMRGLARYEGAPVEEIREASRRALENLIQLALQEGASFVVLSGDVFDGDWRDYNTGLFFVSQMARLNQAGVRVFLAAGNHDALSPISRSLRMPGNVHVFSTRTCESVHMDKLGAVVHGRGFPGRAVEENWVPSYPEPERGAFNIGILHTSLAGYAGHDTYAPCTMDALIGKGYDYWALGHVHSREVLSTSPHIVFPGNIQGRHIRETGPKGCMLVSVDNREVIEAEFRELDVLRWYSVSLEMGDFNVDELMAAFCDRIRGVLSDAGGRIAAVRTVIKAGERIHGAWMQNPDKWRSELRAAAIDAGRGDLWLEKIVFAGGSGRGRVPDGLLGELVRGIHQMGENEAAHLRVGRAALRKLFEKLPAELTLGEDALSPDDEEWIEQALREGLDLFMARIAGPGGRG